MFVVFSSTGESVAPGDGRVPVVPWLEFGGFTGLFVFTGGAVGDGVVFGWPIFGSFMGNCADAGRVKTVQIKRQKTK